MIDFHWAAQFLVGGLDDFILGHYLAIQLLASARLALALLEMTAFIDSVSCVFSGPGHPPRPQAGPGEAPDGHCPRTTAGTGPTLEGTKNFIAVEA